MKNLILTLILILYMTSPGYSQSLKDFDFTTQTFDLKTFQEKNTKGSYFYYLDDNICVYQYDEGDNFYKEIISHKDSPYRVEREYYHNGKLHYQGIVFYSFDIGQLKMYDENGNIERINNYDYLYTFTVEDLIQKMKALYGIDLNVRMEEISVARHITSPKKDNKPLYTVYYPLIEKDSIKRDGALVKNRIFYIDGSNGDITVEDYVEFNSYYKEESDRVGTYITARYYLFNEKWGLKKITEKTLYWNDSPELSPDILEEKVIFDISKQSEGAYKIYKGKSYTREQWMEEEERMYQAYLKKRNSKR